MKLNRSNKFVRRIYNNTRWDWNDPSDLNICTFLRYSAFHVLGLLAQFLFFLAIYISLISAFAIIPIEHYYSKELIESFSVWKTIWTIFWIGNVSVIVVGSVMAVVICAIILLHRALFSKRSARFFAYIFTPVVNSSIFLYQKVNGGEGRRDGRICKMIEMVDEKKK